MLRWYGIILGFISIFAFGVACDSDVGEGRATLPEGMETQLVPDAEFPVYMYFRPATPVNIAVARFLPSDAPELPPETPDGVPVTPESVPVSGASFILAGPEQFAGTLEFPTEEDAQTAFDLYQHLTADGLTMTHIATTTVHVVRGDTEWTARVLLSFESETRAPLNETNPKAWNLVTNLPISEDDPPVAAGIIPIDNEMVQWLAQTAGIGVEGLETAYEMVRVETVAYAVYAALPEDIPSQIDVQFLNDTSTGIVLVSGTNYPGVAVAFLVRSIASKLGMDTIDIGNTNARYLRLEDAHLILKNKGSLVYATVSGTRLHAEELMLRALTE